MNQFFISPYINESWELNAKTETSISYTLWNVKKGMRMEMSHAINAHP